jgi:hypothetical protein
MKRKASELQNAILYNKESSKYHAMYTDSGRLYLCGCMGDCALHDKLGTSFGYRGVTRRGKRNDYYNLNLGVV